MVKLNVFGTGFTLQAAIWAACGMAFILFGYDQGVFSGIVENEDFLDTMGNPGDSLMGIIVSIYNLGCFAGCIVNFLIGDWLGRRKAMWLAMVWVIIGATLQASAFSVPHMMVGRFVTGIGTGIETSTVPMYQAELCEASKRGKLVCSEPLLDYPNCLKVVIILVFGLPESPRYCYKEGRDDEALQILSDVYGRPKDDAKILVEQAEILEALAIETKHGEYKWRYFIPTVLNTNVGLTKNLSMIVGGCAQIMFVVGSFFPTFFVDRVGRRTPMMWGSFGLGICMMMVSILLSFKGKENGHATSSASNFFVVMITPVIINRLQWKAYLIFMCTNFAFVPLVYFCYPETAKLSLEEIDYLFTQPDKSAVKVSLELQKERKRHGHGPSLVADTGVLRRTSAVPDEGLEKNHGVDEHVERV
ncbi:hypothetical protein APSETT444_002880 [Aspergillus pseudonomiae]